MRGREDIHRVGCPDGYLQKWSSFLCDQALQKNWELIRLDCVAMAIAPYGKPVCISLLAYQNNSLDLSESKYIFISHATRSITLGFDDEE